MPRIVNIVGLRFGRLVVAAQTDARLFNCVVWRCQCDCGNVALVPTIYLKSGRTRSCGCLFLEASTARLVDATRTHGHTHLRKESPTYRSWLQAKMRCFRKSHKDYKRWGARGITMCDRWKDSFAAFLSDMGERPKGTTLDRFPNNAGNYEPGNCRWATPKQQAQNRRPSPKRPIQILRRITIELVRSWNQRRLA